MTWPRGGHVDRLRGAHRTEREARTTCLRTLRPTQGTNGGVSTIHLVAGRDQGSDRGRCTWVRTSLDRTQRSKRTGRVGSAGVRRSGIVRRTRCRTCDGDSPPFDRRRTRRTSVSEERRNRGRAVVLTGRHPFARCSRRRCSEGGRKEGECTDASFVSGGIFHSLLVPWPSSLALRSFLSHSVRPVLAGSTDWCSQISLVPLFPSRHGCAFVCPPFHPHDVREEGGHSIRPRFPGGPPSLLPRKPYSFPRPGAFLGS